MSEAKKQAIIDFDSHREALKRFERYARKVIAQGKVVTDQRLAITGDAGRKAAFKVLVDGSDQTMTGIIDDGMLAGTITTYLKGKFPDPEPVAVEPPE